MHPTMTLRRLAPGIASLYTQQDPGARLRDRAGTSDRCNYRQLTNELNLPRPGQKDTEESEREKPLLSRWISLLKKCLTGPTLLEMSGNPGDLNRSMQHLLKVHLHRAEQAKVVREC